MAWEPSLERCLSYIHIVRDKAKKYNLNPDLVLAMIFQESDGHIWSYRVEKGLNLVYMPTVFHKKLFISYDTECLFQNTSWGVLHILGVKARELGFLDHLPMLLQVETGLEWGCKAIDSFRKIFPYEEDYISAYNGGAGAVYKKTIAGYSNQAYVDGVKMRWASIERENLFT